MTTASAASTVARAASSWPYVADDLRKAMLRPGRSPAVVDRILDDFRPVFAAVKRARGRVEDELASALLAVAADRARRNAHNVRVAP
jgi:hypothetical protein